MTILSGLIFLLIFLLPLGQLGRINLAPGVNLYAHDAILGLFLAIAGITTLAKRKFTVPPLGKPLAFFSVVALLSLLLALPHRQSREVLIGSLYLWRFIAYAGVYLVLAQPHLIKPSHKKKIPQALMAAGFIAAIVGLLQYLLLPDTRFLFTSNWDTHYYRLIGPWLDPGFTGIMLVLTLLLSFQKSLSSKLPVSTIYLLRSVVFAALLLTYSRSSYLSLITGLVVIAWLKKNIKIALIGTVGVIIGALLLPRPGGEGVRLERTQSVFNRLDNSQKILEIVKDKPFFGIGFNLLRYEQRDRGFLGENWQRDHAGAGADNSFLFVLTSGGIIGLIAYIGLLKKEILLGLKNRHAVLTSSLMAVIVHAQFNNTLFYPWVMLWLWFLLALNSKESK